MRNWLFCVSMFLLREWKSLAASRTGRVVIFSIFFHISFCLCLSDTISNQLLASMQRHQLTVVGKEQSPSWKIWSILFLDRKQRMGEVKIAGPPSGWSWIRQTKGVWMGRFCLSFSTWRYRESLNNESGRGEVVVIVYEGINAVFSARRVYSLRFQLLNS